MTGPKIWPRCIYHCEISSRTGINWILLKIANIWPSGDMRCRSWVLTIQIGHKWSVLIGSYQVWSCSDPWWLYIRFSSKGSAIKRLGLTPQCIGFRTKITKSISGQTYFSTLFFALSHHSLKKFSTLSWLFLLSTHLKWCAHPMNQLGFLSLQIELSDWFSIRICAHWNRGAGIDLKSGWRRITPTSREDTECLVVRCSPGYVRSAHSYQTIPVLQ